MDLIPRKFYFNDIFDDFLTTRESNKIKCDVYEKAGDYHIEMDIPGYDKKDINIESKDGYLTITAEKNEESDSSDEEKNYIHRERIYGKYQRSFYLGDVKEEKIDASFKDGTLKIVIPKEEVIESKKTIEIK